MTIDYEVIMKRLDARREAMVVHLADGILAAERDDLMTRVYGALRLAYARGYERARIEQTVAAEHCDNQQRSTP